ncbi:hypothetical protein EVAR_24681_1 [Eumeta japonica]|uniref:Uncharacterized protein n=1 Tax=Eumeta variegata TaxID=151549 RepID=A0A4C1WDA2_EUMVA|nr:hypothetical protein EVAR_24681_1 [Eumeta japonica]
MALKLPVFNSCCFCIDLRIGSLIIGYVQLVTQGITLAFALILLVAGITLAGDPEQRENGYILVVFSILMLCLLIPIYCFTIFLIYGIHIVY